MRYAFFGTPEFAAIVLDELISAGYPPALLVCNPDRPVGRKKIITAPPAKQVVLARAPHIPEIIEILQPEKFRDIEEMLKHGNYDFFVIAAYGKIIPKSSLAIPRFGTIGVHPSLLPAHRGSSPIQSTILNGDREAGVTLYMVDDLVDHGPVVAEEKLPAYDADNATYKELHDALAKLGTTMLVKLMPFIGSSSHIIPHVQDESKATFTKKFITDDGFVSEEDLNKAENGDVEKASDIYRKIRALNPEPGVFTIRDGIRTKLLSARMESNRLKLTVIQRAGETPREV